MFGVCGHQERRLGHLRRAGPARACRLLRREQGSPVVRLKQSRHVTLLETGTAVAEASVPYQMDGVVRLVTAGTAEMELYKKDAVTTSVSWTGSCAAGEGG